CCLTVCLCFFFSSRRRHTRSKRDWSSDVCSSDLDVAFVIQLSFAVVPVTHPKQSLHGCAGGQLQQRSSDHPRQEGQQQMIFKGRSEERRVGKECRSEWAEDG